jgi:hypothetical protein
LSSASSSSPCWRGQEAAAQRPTASPRSRLVRCLFTTCDEDFDGFLGEHELRVIAVHSGFEGNDAQWRAEYELICSEFNAPPSCGLDLDQLRCLLDDVTDSGCYHSDEELQSLIVRLGRREPVHPHAPHHRGRGSDDEPGPALDDLQVRRRRHRPSQAARRARRAERALQLQAVRPIETLAVPTRPTSTRGAVVVALETAEAASCDAEAAAAVAQAEALVRTLRAPVTSARASAVLSRLRRLCDGVVGRNWRDTADALTFFVQAVAQAREGSR